MITRNILTNLATVGALIISGGMVQAQLYKSPDKPIDFKQPNFRKGNEGAGAPTYAPTYAPMEEIPEEVAAAPVIPPPPIPPTVQPEPTPEPEPEIVKAPAIPEPKVEPAPEPEPYKPAPPVRKTPVVTPKPVTKAQPVIVSTPVPQPRTEPIGSTRSYPPTRQIGRYDPPASPVIAARPVPTPNPNIYQPVETPPFSRPQAQPEPRVQARQVFPQETSHAHNFPASPGNQNRSTLTTLREEANLLARQGIEFRFGRSHPAFGGLDSSGAVQYLLNEVGIPGVPRTTNGLNGWVRVNNHLREFVGRPTISELTNGIVPGNLIFWGDNRNGRLTHVMIYLGYDSNRGQHLAFGTRGGTEVGINGNEVDIFTLKLDREKIIATGKVPGLEY